MEYSRAQRLKKVSVGSVTLPLPGLLAPTPYTKGGRSDSPLLSQKPLPHELEILY